ncbi:MAG: zinc ribbon domain-containing protein [Gemmatimonadaceae bacterium]
MMLALPEGAVPLAVGTVLALGGLSLVLSPLISEDEASTSSPEGGTAARPRAVRAVRAKPTSTASDEEAADGPIAALREIEFDRATGKLSDQDYQELKQRYTQLAIDEMRAADRAAAGIVASVGTAARPTAVPVDAEEDRPGEDPVEAAIRRARAEQKACDVCGPRPEADADYCSSCGRYLPGACGHCGTSVDLVGSRFCTNCGEQLALV